jgi:hypothetical protein
VHLAQDVGFKEADVQDPLLLHSETLSAVFSLLDKAVEILTYNDTNMQK